MTPFRRIVPALLIVFALAALAARPAAAADDAKAKSQADARAAYGIASGHMADRDFARAAKEFGALADKIAPEAGLQSLGEECSYLAARAQFLAGDAKACSDTSAAFLTRSPQSVWVNRLRGLRAEALLKLGQPAESARLYRETVDSLGGPEATRALAEFFRSLALEFYQGPEPDPTRASLPAQKQIDFNRAAGLFTRAKTLGVDPKDLPAMLNAIAYSYFRLQNYEAASAQWRELVACHKDSPEAAEAQYHLGLYYLQVMNQPSSAREMFGAVVDRHKDSPWAPAAQYQIGATFVPTSADDRETLRARVDAWKVLAERFPTSSYAAQAAFELAETHRGAGDARTAIAAWMDYIEKFSRHPRVAEAWFNIGATHLSLNDFDKAIGAWQRLLSDFPSSALWTSAQEQIVQASFNKAAYFLAEKKYEAAAEAWTAFIDKFPLSPLAALAQYQLGEVKIAQEQILAAVEEWKKTAEKFPGSPVAPKALLRMAQVLETKANDPDGALVVYTQLANQYGGTAEGQTANLNLNAMQQKSLLLRVDRAYTTAEPVLLHVETRNIQKLNLRAYRLDLVDYFRKKQAVAGVDQIATEIVKPDQTWEDPIPEYRKLRQVVRDVPLPFKEAGAWILVASEEDFTATTLVLVTDLAIVTKESPTQVLAWVKNERTGQPEPGATVLVTNGTRVFTEGKTDADGICMIDRSKESGTIRVLATKDRHYASNESALTGACAFGYQTQGYVFTDRPVYRPGQTVKLKAILRKVTSGFYETPANEDVHLAAIDARGMTTWEADFKTNPFGTVTAEIPLSEGASLGTYTLKGRYLGMEFSGTFGVESYRKPDVIVNVTPEKEVYGLGEEMAVKVKVQYAFGGAVANTAVRYRAFAEPYKFDLLRYEDFSWYFRQMEVQQAQAAAAENPEAEVMAEGDAFADEKGEATIKLPAIHAAMDASLVVIVGARDSAGRWIRGSASIPVTARSYFAVLKASKKLYQPGENVPVKVMTVNALHSPVAGEGKVIPVRMRVVEGRTMEDALAPVAVKTDESGTSTVELKLEKAGDYVLKFQGADSHGRLVGGSTPVQVAGDAEDLAKTARVSFEKQYYREGETAKLQVLSPAAQSVALLTFEADRVLDYKVLKLDRKVTPLEWAMKAPYAPNVFVKVALASQGKLYESQEEIFVFKYLAVDVKADKTAVQPRETVNFTITTKDQNGNPVPAEVSFALADETLFQIRSDSAPDIRGFFYKGHRDLAVATRASYEFKYEGKVGTTNKDLVEESRRKGDMLKKIEEGVSFRDGKEAELRAMEKLAREVGERDRAMDHNESDDEAMGEGGGSGGKFGGRMGGKKSLVVRGGGSRMTKDKAANGPARKPGSPMAAPSPAEEAPDAGAIGALIGDSEDFVGYKSQSQMSTNALVLEENLAGLDIDQNYWNAKINGATPSQSADGYWRTPRRTRVEWATPELRKEFADMAKWEPCLVTDAQGTATVAVTLPDNLTAWRATVRGITQQTLVGTGYASVVAKKDVLVRLETPRFFTQGDEAKIGSFVHNNLPKDALLKHGVKLMAEPDSSPCLELTGEGFEKIVGTNLVVGNFWQVAARKPGLVRFHAEALTGAQSDALEVSLPTLPHGARNQTGRSGLVLDKAFEELNIPSDAMPESVSLRIDLADTLDAHVLDALQYLEDYPYGCIEQTLNRFSPGIQAYRALQNLGLADAKRMDKLKEVVNRGLARVVDLQNQDGSWGWFGGGQADPYTTAYVMMCLAEARNADFRVNPTTYDRGLAALRQILDQQTADPDARAFLGYALALNGAMHGEDFARLFAVRDALGTYGLSVLALSAPKIGRDAQGIQLAALIEGRAKAEAGLTHWTAKAGGGWMNDEVETTAYALQALATLTPSSPSIAPAIDWIRSKNQGGVWGSTKQTAAVIRAVTTFMAKGGGLGGPYEATLVINDKPVKKWSTREGRLSAEDRHFNVPATALQTGNNRVRLEKNGPGKLAYALRLNWLARGEDLPALGTALTLRRLYHDKARSFADPSKWGAAEFHGYDIVRPERRPEGLSFTNLSTIQAGSSLEVTLLIESKEDLSYVIIEDPVPAGCEVDLDHATGPFAHKERWDDRAVFFLSRLPKGTTTITYNLDAVFPGAFHVMPGQTYPMYRPELFGRTAENRLAIAEPKTDVVASIVPTPDQQYLSAIEAFRAGRWAEAAPLLQKLLDRDDLLDNIQLELFGAIVTCDVQLKKWPELVRHYQGLLERNPSFSPDLETLRALALAHEEVGQQEPAAYLSLRLLGELYNRQRTRVDALNELSRSRNAAEALQMLILTYPALNAVSADQYRLGLDWLTLAANPPAPAVGAAEPQPDFQGLAVTALQRFLAHYPESPQAHDVEYRLLQEIARAGKPDWLTSESEALIRRYPKSEYTDEAQMFLAQGYFAADKFDRASAAAVALVNQQFPDGSGNLRSSPYAEVGHYVMAKVFHAQGNLAEAARHYALTSYGDAPGTLKDLTGPALNAPARLSLTTKDTATLKVRARNVTEVRAKLYKVDLLTLLAARKDLSDLRQVDLTGITPLEQWSQPVSAAPFSWGDVTMKLPLKDRGAYLVVLKAGDLDASTLVIQSDIDLVVIRDGAKIRASVRDGAGKPVKGAFLRVSDSTKIACSGYTDARGLFEGDLDPNTRKFSVVVDREGNVALHAGE